MEWEKIVLQGDFSFEGLAAAKDLDGVGAGEGFRQFDVALNIYKCREDDFAILIQKLDGRAKSSVACCKRVTVEI